MQVLGEWYECDDGVERPVIHGRTLAANGSWVQTPFLVDTGADRTVLSSEIFDALSLPNLPLQFCVERFLFRGSLQDALFQLQIDLPDRVLISLLPESATNRAFQDRRG